MKPPVCWGFGLTCALTVGAILPLTVLGTFVVMQSIGLTANLMSLGGIAIAIGILVDSAVVMVENIHSRLQTVKPEKRAKALVAAAQEMAVPILSGVVIIVVSLAPILSLSGIEGKLFQPLAMTIAVSMLVSLVLSLTVIPVLGSLVMKSGGEEDNWLIRAVKRGYGAALRAVLGRPVLSLSIAVGLLVVSILLSLRIGKEFLPYLDEGTLVVQYEKLPTISLEKSLEIDNEIAKQLMAIPEITACVARLGSDELRLGQESELE